MSLYTGNRICTGRVGVGRAESTFLLLAASTVLRSTCALGNGLNRKYNLIGQGGGGRTKILMTFDENAAKPIKTFL